MPSAPKLGALGHTFTAMRAMQFISLVAVIGMTANFISEINDADAAPPAILVGTLVISCIATLYIAISYILYYDSMLPLLVATAADTALLIAVIVVACLLGKPLSYLSCAALPSSGSTASFMNSVTANIDPGSALEYFVWVGAGQKTCYAIKAVWGLSIALCVLFAFSAITAACLWRRLKLGPAAVGPKDIEATPAPIVRLPPPVVVRGRSLGTAALNRTRASDHVPHTPWFPPTTQGRAQKRVEVVNPPAGAAASPVLPEMVLTPPPPSPGASSKDELLVSRKPLARGRSKRKTIMEFIDGWWDLGLLEAQRQTVLAKNASKKG
ncbi:hypothetical protein Cob_v010897 [Colletotrichum orbiculare MAFF 240422]|uniref:MARVEL domain-containing protein n=1 Tax=Colletotrichum orbiculare (strain 104-T / ATCC 96160 / CBS 514.97 / LARS 414 / MAFF 240422) TaxID=1213857 RepID=N4VDR7_COLOR|nr:hypothetical protein Cob_v010897 [Colletotrichum orbiculare MAFF 240422]